MYLLSKKNDTKYGHISGWEIAMAYGWESEGPRLQPLRLHATFDPGLPKK